MRRFPVLVMLVLLAIPVAAAAAESTALEQRTWRIASYSDGSRLVTPLRDYLGGPVPKPAPWPTMTLAGGRIEGSPGCGALAGTYKLDNDKLSLQASYIIAGLCPPEALRQTKLLLEAFGRVRSFRMAGGQVLLLDARGGTEAILDH